MLMVGQMEVSKEFTFDCAHMLTGHDGLCKNLHGHTYKLIISLEGVLQDRGSSKEIGRAHV